MNTVAVVIVASVLLGGCQALMPIPTEEVPDLPRTNKGQGLFYGGACHYDNGEVSTPAFGSIVCH